MIALAIIWLALGAWALRIFSNSVGFKQITRTAYDKFMCGVIVLYGPVTLTLILVIGSAHHGISKHDLFS